MDTSMPLFEMSPNVQEPESVTRKRSHDAFADDLIKSEEKTPSKTNVRPSGDSLLPPVSHNVINSSPHGSPALTEAGSSTPAQNSPSPRTPTKSNPLTNDTTSSVSGTSSTGAVNLPAKKKKLTPAEREAREKELADKKKEKEREQVEKKKERDEKAQQAAAKKAKLEEEKAARQKEREEKRKKKEEEDIAKAEQREEKKRQKEEEQQRIQEEKDRKARSQKTLNNFFMMPKTPRKANDDKRRSVSPAKLNTESTDTEQAMTESEYSKLFKPFFVKDNTRVAPTMPNLDDEARALKSRIVDECVAGTRGDAPPFDAVQLFSLPKQPQKRGRMYPSVRQIMETAYREMEASGNAGSNSALDIARLKLKNISFKVIAFSQDVRPPYFGTVTSRPQILGHGIMQKQSRCSSKQLLSLDYEYDSEAEWQEEEGEDIDVDDDEEELDDEDDMDGFLDDSEDSGLSRRIFGTTMEPDSTGICFEDENRKGPSMVTLDHRMEIILDIPNTNQGIDPFTTSYWEPEPKSKAKAPSQSSNATAQMPPPPAPANAFVALKGCNASDSSEQLKLVKKELLNDVKQAILDNKALSKVGIIDYIFQQFRDNVSRAEVKNTLELVAEKKKGSGRTKEWDLKPGHEISL